MLRVWLSRYGGAGVATIPLKAGSKAPLCPAWATRPPSEQWAEVGSHSANIGVLCGKGLAVLDCDDLRAAGTVGARLGALGLKVPTVETAHGGRHYYLHVEGAPADVTWRRLAPAVGNGELRVRNAYVVAPCSEVDGKGYRFVVGAPEDLPGLKAVLWVDLAPLVTPWEGKRIASPPLRLLWRPMPEKVKGLFCLLADAGPGQEVAGYATRSEAEASVVTTLVLCGWSFEQIAAAFEEHQPGHYKERGRHRLAYLRRTYENVLAELAASPTRRELAEAYRAAEKTAWPGRTGALDKAVYLGLLAIAWQCDTWSPFASVRELAEYASASVGGVRHALRRLCASGLIEWGASSEPWLATQWTIRRFASSSLPSGPAFASPPAPPTPPLYTVTYVSSLCIRNDNVCETGEVWGQGLLGRTAGEAYRCLGEDVLSVKELAARSGRSRNAVAQALRVLWRHGLAEPVGDGRHCLWKRGAASVSQVARDLGAGERGERRRSKHQRERAAWRRHVKAAGAPPLGECPLRGENRRWGHIACRRADVSRQRRVKNG